MKSLLKMKGVILCAGILLSGCAANPAISITKNFDENIIYNESNSSIVTSVLPAKESYELFIELLNEKVPGRKLLYMPTFLNGKNTTELADKFAGLPVDGNFRVRLLAGEVSLGFSHYDGDLTKKYLINFNVDFGHVYYTKFVTVFTEDNKHFRILAIIYDINLNRFVEYRFVSDEII